VITTRPDVSVPTTSPVSRICRSTARMIGGLDVDRLGQQTDRPSGGARQGMKAGVATPSVNASLSCRKPARGGGSSRFPGPAADIRTRLVQEHGACRAPSSAMVPCRTILRATAATSTGERSPRSSSGPGSARWSAATCCAKRTMQSSERSPKRFSVPPTPAAHCPASQPAAAPSAAARRGLPPQCRALGKVSGRSRQT
jgi:hypothetical protein